MASENPTTEAPQESFKQQLDQAAAESREKDQGQQTNPIIEKITEYVPAAANLLGTSKQSEETEQKPDVPGPPNRPDHDDNIEEFVRDQHRSKADDGTLLTKTGG